MGSSDTELEQVQADEKNEGADSKKLAPFSWIGKRILQPQSTVVLREPQWAARVSSIRPSITNAFVALGSIFAGWIFDENKALSALAAGIVVIALVADHLRELRNDAVENEKLAYQEEAIRSLVHTTVDSLQGIGDAVVISGKHERERNVSAARRAILSAVRQNIGPDSGLRVNFFEVVNVENPSLEASSYGHEGRLNHRSTRVFTLRDKSMQKALLKNEGRFVEDTEDLQFRGECKDRKPPIYGTFATMPVSTADHLFGILTVDAMEAGSIARFEAETMLNLFASQLALTFAGDTSALKLEIGEHYELENLERDGVKTQNNESNSVDNPHNEETDTVG